MIILRKEKQFARITGVARGYRNYIDLPIREFINTKLKPVAKRKTKRQVMEGSVRAGRAIDKGITQPLAVGADVVKSVYSNPLQAVGTTMVAVPLPTTLAGAGILGANKFLRSKFPALQRAAERRAARIAESGWYRNAQSSTRGFHNGFGLIRHSPSPVPVGAI